MAAPPDDHPGDDRADDGRRTDERSADDPLADRFTIPARPERRFTPSGGVEHAGGTVFAFEPPPCGEAGSDGGDGAGSDGESGPAFVAAALEAVLARDRYVAGDWYDLPGPLFLVNDRAVGTSFRVLVRADHLALHVLPGTEPAGVRALFEALQSTTAADWTVSRRVVDP